MIFSRSDIQEAVYEIKRNFSREAAIELCSHLNSGEDQFLNYEWEAIILSRLSRKMKLRHQSREGAPNLDVVAVEGEIPILAADIFTLWDTDSDEKGHARNLRVQASAILKKAGIDPSTYRLRVNLIRNSKGSWKEGVPLKSDQSRFLNALKKWAPTANPNQCVRFKSGAYDIELIHGAKSREALVDIEVMHPTVPQDVKSNRLTGRLEEKRKQAKKSGLDCPRVIFVADGGSRELARSGERLGYDTPSLRTVIETYLRKTQSISGVYVIRARLKNFSGVRDQKVEFEYFENCSARNPLPSAMISSIEGALDELPDFQTGAGTAAQWWLDHGMMDDDRRQNIRVGRSGLSFMFSSNDLRDLLCGRLTVAEIEGRSRVERLGIFNTLLEGRKIESVRIVKRDGDDDHIEIVTGRDALTQDFIVGD